MAITKRTATTILTVYIAFVFIQSLFFKFTNSPETQYIFGVLDSWGGTLGFPGLFLPPGIFNAYVVGSAELLASCLMLASLVVRKPILTLAGALLSLGIISGAIFFHLFTPLGVEVQGDGGLLFTMACGVWLAAAALLLMHRKAL
jgi:uncharacterized membrane protein YphA (DoxX/SURF4 family)